MTFARTGANSPPGREGPRAETREIRLPRGDEASIGSIIERIRRLRGWSVEDLAERANIQPSTLRRIERGATRVPHHNTLRRIEDVADLPRLTIAVGADRLSDSRFSLDDLVAPTNAGSPQRRTGDAGAEVDVARIGFGHSLFGAPVVWDLARDGAERRLRAASYASRQGESADVSPKWLTPPSSGRPDGRELPLEDALEAPRLPLEQDPAAPLQERSDAQDFPVFGICKHRHRSVLEVSPLFGPTIKRLWIANEIDVAITMREAFEEFTFAGTNRGLRARHCASISHGSRGCQLIALINPGASPGLEPDGAGDRYVDRYVRRFGARSDKVRGVRDLAVDFMMNELLAPSRPRFARGGTEYLVTVSDSNAEKQLESVPWFNRDSIIGRDVSLESFGALWDSIRGISDPATGRGADVIYVVLWEPLTTWVRYMWSQAACRNPSAAATAGPVMKVAPGGLENCPSPAEREREDVVYAWSVEAPLEVIAGLGEGSPPLAQIKMDIFVRDQILMDREQRNKLDSVRRFIDDLHRTIGLYRLDLHHKRFQGQIAAYLSMPRARCVRALRDIEFEMAYDLSWFEGVGPSWP